MENKYNELLERFRDEFYAFERSLKGRSFSAILAHANWYDAYEEILYALEHIFSDSDDAERIYTVLTEEGYTLDGLAEIVIRRLDRDTLPITIDAIYDETDRSWLSK